MPVNKGEKILVAVPEFASLDEMAAGIILSRVLSKLGGQVNFYLGPNNYALKLQKLLPTEEVKLYQPNSLPNEVKVSMRLNDGQLIKGIRWEQDKDELHLFIESDQDIGQEPEIEFARKNKFDKLFLIGAYDIKRLENFRELEKYTDIPQKISYVSNILAPANISGNEDGLINTKAGSISELILVIANQRQVELDEKDLEILLLGAQYARQLSGKLFLPLSQAFLEELKKKNIDQAKQSLVALGNEDWRILSDFWKDEIIEGPSQITYEDLLALLLISQQINPLIPTTGGYLQNKAEGKTFYRELGTSDRIVFISDDLRYQPAKDVTTFSYRRFEHFLIGWYQRGGQSTTQVTQLSQPAPIVETKPVELPKPAPVSMEPKSVNTQERKGFVPLQPATQG
jgi:hypothetical protein